ncbi:uncharacterized protein ARMOST_07663 [Armillaria ostoyae]|uniref:Uncharacterized protein n=1 Tax=Armillaria ostoyae TaxID=47428 RepID=A0A284R6I9_ARMOS|nr:uncharacterized protein ARMOST_07663 [Armillaria ostoyae]
MLLLLRNLSLGISIPE